MDEEKVITVSSAYEQKRVLRAAYYARVSTNSDTQDGSFEGQCEYYEKMIRDDPTLEFVGGYGDHGKSGRSIEHRDEFQRMVNDAESGKIDIIFCKSLSRFARNMRECLQTVRKLTAKGVALVFQREGLDTRTMAGELILSLMAAISEEESRSIAENIRSAQKKALQRGVIWGRASYGYEADQQKRWSIKEPEAEHVRELFRMAASGLDYPTIVKRINEMEIEENTGKVWNSVKIRYLLTSEVYIGDYRSNKECVLMEKDGRRRRIKNNGQQPQYYLENHHPPIVSRELFESVNDMIHRNMLSSRKKYWTQEEAAIVERAQRCLNDWEGYAENNM